MTQLAFLLIAGVTPRSDRESVVCDTQERFDELRRSVSLSHARRWLWRETARVIANAPRHHLAVLPVVGLGNHLEAQMASGRGIGKWLVLGLVAAGALTGYVLSGRSPEYRSEATLSLVPSRVPDDVVAPVRSAGRLDERLLTIQRTVLSRTRLERLITDFNLYEADRKSGRMVMQDIVERMRSKIDVHVDSASSANAAGVFVVSFSDPDPRTAQRVTGRLTEFFIEENLKEAERQAGNTITFVDAQVEEVGRRLNDVNERLARTKTSEDAARLQIEAEVVRESYKALLAKREQALMRVNLERRQIGEQLVLLDQARLPERPVGPTRTAGAIAGALAGLSLALVVILLIVVRRALAARARTEVAAS